MHRVLWQQGRDSLPAESLQGSCCETQLPGVRLGLGLSKLHMLRLSLSKCHPFYFQYFPVMITISTNTHIIYARYQPPDHQPLQHREVDSWGILRIHENSTEGLDSWSSSFSSQSMLSLLKYVIVTHIRTVPPNIHSCRGREARLVKHLPHGFLRIAYN